MLDQVRWALDTIGFALSNPLIASGVVVGAVVLRDKAAAR
ncbi:hypothetical protein SAMN04488564_102575 [Lentzea waywayandensis]|uniref:Uncharacterized protein n=1 Tax=Lentzea waywayandensis TaxID=84724 RepID=A0A1I6DGT1_9PSEU|nr:hypothetical protein SAMN04488564_102575 [Lentzea waywayandensis]